MRKGLQCRINSKVHLCIMTILEGFAVNSTLLIIKKNWFNHMNIQFHLAQHKTKYTSMDLIRTSVAEVPEGTYDYNYRDTCLLIRYPTNQTISSSEAHKVLLLYTYIVYIHTLSYVYVCTYNNVDTYIYILCVYIYICIHIITHQSTHRSTGSPSPALQGAHWPFIARLQAGSSFAYSCAVESWS